jgi:hypothetical protein
MLNINKFRGLLITISFKIYFHRIFEQAKFPDGGSILGSSQFSILPRLPPIQKGSKIIIWFINLNRWHTLYDSLQEFPSMSVIFFPVWQSCKAELQPESSKQKTLMTDRFNKTQQNERESKCKKYTPQVYIFGID